MSIKALDLIKTQFCIYVFTIFAFAFESDKYTLSLTALIVKPIV